MNRVYYIAAEITVDRGVAGQFPKQWSSIIDKDVRDLWHDVLLGYAKEDANVHGFIELPKDTRKSRMYLASYPAPLPAEIVEKFNLIRLTSVKENYYVINREAAYIMQADFLTSPFMGQYVRVLRTDEIEKVFSEDVKEYTDVHGDVPTTVIAVPTTLDSAHKAIMTSLFRDISVHIKEAQSISMKDKDKGLLEPVTEEESAKLLGHRAYILDNVLKKLGKKRWLDEKVEFYRGTNGELICVPIGEQSIWSDEKFWDAADPELAKKGIYYWSILHRSAEAQHVPLKWDKVGRRYHYVNHDGEYKIRSFTGSSKLSDKDILSLAMKSVSTNGLEYNNIMQRVAHDAFTERLLEDIYYGGEHPLSNAMDLGNPTADIAVKGRWFSRVLPLIYVMIEGVDVAMRERLKTLSLTASFSRVIISDEAGIDASDPIYTRFLLEILMPLGEKRYDPEDYANISNNYVSSGEYAITNDILANSGIGEMITRDKKASNLIDSPEPELIKDIPHINKDLTLFPHQPAALAAMQANKNFILDADVGAGKTIMALCDMLLLLRDGKIKKPAMCMPDNLIAQQREEILKFTDNSVNVIIINSETCKFIKAKEVNSIDDRSDFKGTDEEWLLEYDFDFKALAMNDKSPRVIENNKLLDDNPPNTIYLVSYSWLSGYTHMIKQETKEFKTQKTFISYGAEWLAQHGIDYCFMDESHKLAKPTTAVTRGSRSLMQNCKYRRLASGTVMPNTPEDLYHQVAPLEPALFGSLKNFLGEYANTVHRGKTRSFKADAAKKIRSRVKNGLGISIRREHWLHVLPKRTEEIHYVKLTDKQQKIYEAIRDASLGEINGDVEMKNALAANKNANEDSTAKEDASFNNLLGRIGRIDRAVNAGAMDEKLGAPIIEGLAAARIKLTGDPDQDALLKREAMEKYLGDDIKSPKTDKVDAIIESHLAEFPDAKILVMGTNKAAVLSVMEYSRFKGKGVYYDASRKKEILTFKNDPNVRVLYGVDASLLEGHNMIYANCIIRIDLPWGSGSLEQNYGRVYRFGQQKEVRLHIVLAENTADITRFSRLASKKQQSAKVNSDYDSETDEFVFSMSVANMQKVASINSAEFIQAKDTYFSILEDEYRRNKSIKEKIGSTMIRGTANGSKLKGSGTSGIVQILKPNRLRAMEDKKAWMKRLDEDGKKGFGAMGKWEFGGLPEEAISKEGRTLMHKGLVNVHLSVYEAVGYDPEFFLEAKLVDDESKSLHGAGFERYPKHKAWVMQIKNATHAKSVLLRIIKKLGGNSLKKDGAALLGTDYEEIMSGIRDYLKRGKFRDMSGVDVDDEELLGKLEGIKGLTLNLIDGEMFFLVDEADNNHASLSALRQVGFKRFKPAYFYAVHNKNGISQALRRFRGRGIRVANIEELTEQVRKGMRIKLVNPWKNDPPLVMGDDGILGLEDTSSDTEQEKPKRRKRARSYEDEETKPTLAA